MESIVPLLIFIILGVVAYFLPALIAARRKHPQANAILMLDLLLGWTFIGWAIALVWAMTAVKAPPKPEDNTVS